VDFSLRASRPGGRAGQRESRLDVTQIRLSVISSTKKKHVAIDISDVPDVLKAGIISESLLDFCQGALETHGDGTKVELNKTSKRADAHEPQAASGEAQAAQESNPAHKGIVQRVEDFFEGK
jgi:hypothetical protein